MTAILIAESGDIDKVPEIIHECERMGVKVLPPDINESFKNFAMISPEDGSEAHIRFGLNGIKNLGEHIADAIYRERKANGKYKDLQDLITRVQDRDLNKKSLDSLIKCGAMDSFGLDRGYLAGNIENILAYVKQIHEKKSENQNSLFAGTNIDMSTKMQLVPAPNATEDEKLLWEKELLGVYVTAHPFTIYQKIMKDVLTPLKDLSSQSRNQWVVVGGMIDSTKKKITRSGKAMMFAKLLDTTSSLELLVFPKTYETTKDIWIEGKPVCVIGRTSEEEGDDKLFVEKAYLLTPENAPALVKQMAFSQSRPVVKSVQDKENNFEIIVSAEQVKAKADAIKNVLKKYPGDKLVVLNVGGKIIKTSYTVDDSNELKNDVSTVILN
jgi:DNA polymerase-3 subunit alpha